MPLMSGLTVVITNIQYLSNGDAKTVLIAAMTDNAFEDDIGINSGKDIPACLS